MNQGELGNRPTDGKRKQVLYLVSDTARCDCSHGAWADGKQTRSLVKICAEKAPNARVRGATH